MDDGEDRYIGSEGTPSDDSSEFYMTSYGAMSTELIAEEDEDGAIVEQSSINNERRNSGIINLRALETARERMREEQMLRDDKQPASQYSSSLKVEYVGKTYLVESRQDRESIKLYRNNLAVASNEYNLFVIATGATITLYQFSIAEGVPKRDPMFGFDTRGYANTVSREAQVVNANWPMDPHTINFILVQTLNGKEVLITAGDDGRVFIWYMDDLVDWFEAKFEERNRAEGSSEPVDLPPTVVELQCKSSAWGISLSDSHKVLAVSDNSCVVSIFFLEPYLSGQMASVDDVVRIESPKLGHNIPDVQFVETEPEHQKPETFYLACVSISGQVAMWEFYYGQRLREFRDGMTARRTNEQEGESEEEEEIGDPDELERAWIGHRVQNAGPAERDALRNDTMLALTYDEQIPLDIDEPSELLEEQEELSPEDINELTDQILLNIMENRVRRPESRRNTVESIDAYTMREFDGGLWWFQEELKQNGWTINNVREQDFKVVDSMFEATGNKWTNEEALFSWLNKENRRLLGEDSNCELTNHPSARFSNYDIETRFAQNLTHSPWSSVSQTPHHTLPLCQRKDKKIENYLKGRPKELLTNPPFKNEFYICTTKRSLYLCRVEDLMCNAARSNVFNWESPYADEVHFDRLSIVKVIPALSTVIVVSQAGVVSIFRLTRYREIFCMRQEYCIPKADDHYTYLECDKRVIVGVTISPVITNHQDKSLCDDRKFRLCLVRLDGSVTTYELQRPDNDNVYVDSILL